MRQTSKPLQYRSVKFVKGRSRDLATQDNSLEIKNRLDQSRKSRNSGVNRAIDKHGRMQLALEKNVQARIGMRKNGRRIVSGTGDFLTLVSAGASK